MFMLLAVIVSLLLAGVSGVGVAIVGLNQPISISIANGRVYIAEKDGAVKVAANPATDTSAAMLLNIQDETASYGEMGLTSIAVNTNYIYVAYTKGNATCTDMGDPDGRLPAQVEGCVSHGRLSRWGLSADGLSLTSTEEHLLDENSTSTICSQFGVASIDGIALASDGFLYFSAGVGANPYALDYGNFGTDPCHVTGSLWGGAFRAQDEQSLDGKVLRMDPQTKQVIIIAKGLHNPWRFAIDPSNNIYTINTGFESTGCEFIAGPMTAADSTANGPFNFGFPCYECGGVANADFLALNSPYCLTATQRPGHIIFNYSFAAPPVPDAGGVSISALAYGTWTSSSSPVLFFGDYSAGVIGMVKPDGTGATIIAKGPYWPVDMQYDAQLGLLVADIVKGTVKTLVASASTPSASPAPVANSAPPLSSLCYAHALLLSVLVVAASVSHY